MINNNTNVRPSEGNRSVFIDYDYGWNTVKLLNCECHFVGWFRWKNCLYDGKEAGQKIIEIFSDPLSVQKISQCSAKLNGFFSFVLETPASLISVVDKTRSYPVFYTLSDGKLFISNSGRLLQQKIKLYEWNSEARLEFQMTGFVTSNETLIYDLNQLTAGKCLYYTFCTNNLNITRYYEFYSSEKKEQTIEEWLEEFDEVNRVTFNEIIEALNGDPVWIPLSGGLDSRLVLGMLVALGYDNIRTFSYGPPGNWEAKVAEQISDYLNIKWIFKPYTHKKLAKLYSSEKCNRYLEYADGLSVVPFHGDFYILLELLSDGDIPSNACIVNGQSGDFITGGHIPESLMEKSEDYKKIVINSIIYKHYSLWADYKTKKNIGIIENRLLKNLSKLDNLNDIQEAVDMIEFWEWEERQAKFVVNGQRVYDFLNFKWHLPLWSGHYLDFWDKVPFALKYNQYLYRSYLKWKDPANLFSESWEPKYPTPKYLPLLSSGVGFFSKIFGKNHEMMNNKYLKYFMYAGPLYSFLSYKDYLKRSAFHRNVVSFRVYETLKKIAVF